jgi:hypothetical protein
VVVVVPELASAPSLPAGSGHPNQDLPPASYRTTTYNSLRASIERHSRKFNAMKSGSSSGA